MLWAHYWAAGFAAGQRNGVLYFKIEGEFPVSPLLWGWAKAKVKEVEGGILLSMTPLSRLPSMNEVFTE